MCLAHSCTAAKLHTNRHLLPVQPTRRAQQQLSLEIQQQQRQFKQILRPFSFSTTSCRLIQTAGWQASHMAIEGNVLLLISTFITVPMSTFTIISVLALEFLLSTFWVCLTIDLRCKFREYDLLRLKFHRFDLTDILTLSRCYELTVVIDM